MSSTESPPITTALEAELDAALHETLDENDALKAELTALLTENRRLLDWIMGDGPDALLTLQKIYSDPNTPQANVIKTAIGALPFERGKPPSSNVVIVENWVEKTRRIRLETQAKNRAKWALEDQSKVIEGTLAHPEDEPAA